MENCCTSEQVDKRLNKSSKGLLIYNPKILGDFTQEIVVKSAALGLNADGVNTLNVERYINKLQRLLVDGMQLSIMPEQTKEMVLTAIYQNPAAIQFASVQDENSKSIVIAKDPDNIEYINEPTEEDVQMAIDLKPSSILKVKNYTKEQAAKAIEKEVTLIHYIKKELVDESLMLFTLNIVKRDEKVSQFYDQHLKNFSSPLRVFNNEKIQGFAYSVSPLFLSCIEPSKLTEEQILEIAKKYPPYIEKITAEKYYMNQEIALAFLKHYDIVRNKFYSVIEFFDVECFNADFLKEVVDTAQRNTVVLFDGLLNGLLSNKKAGQIASYLHEKVDYIFKDNGRVDLCNLAIGFSHPKVIRFAIKQNKKNKKYLNIWNTKVVRRTYR